MGAGIGEWRSKMELLIGISLVVLAVLLAACLAVLVWVTYGLRQNQRDEAMRMMMICESAMSHIKAANLEEKVQSEAIKKQYDVQLEMLRDTYVQEVDMEKKKLKSQTEYVTLENGDRLSMDDIELP